MAGALRPVVFLMVLASLLFVVDGVLDGAYPGGGSWFGEEQHGGLGALSYAFAAANAAIAVFIARGSERTLMARIGLSAFFLLERPLTAFVLGPKSAAAVAIHLATAIVELVILLGAVRVWQLGRSVGAADVEAAFDLDSPSPRIADDEPAAAAPPGRPSWAVGAAALTLAGLLVADGVVSGYVPGGRAWGLDAASVGWVAYLLAVVVLTAAMPAVHGRPLALRALLALALIVLIERALGPFVAGGGAGVASLALHLAGAFAALGLALATAGAIRGAAGHARRASPQAA